MGFVEVGFGGLVKGGDKQMMMMDQGDDVMKHEEGVWRVVEDDICYVNKF